MRVAAPVRTLSTAGVVTSIELSKDGRHLTTADGKEVKVRALRTRHARVVLMHRDYLCACVSTSCACGSRISSHIVSVSLVPAP